MSIDWIAGLFIPVIGWLAYLHKQGTANAAREAEQELRLKRLEARTDGGERKLDEILALGHAIDKRQIKIESEIEHMKRHVYANGKH